MYKQIIISTALFFCLFAGGCGKSEESDKLQTSPRGKCDFRLILKGFKKDCSEKGESRFLGNIEILNPKFLKEKDELRFLFMSSGKYDYNALKNNAFLKKLGAYLKINNAKTIGNVKFDNQFSFDEKLHISRNKKMTFQISYCSGEIPAEICTKSRVSKFRTGLLEKWQNTLLFKGKSIKFNIDQPVKLFRAKLWDKKGVLFADVKSSLIITRKKDAKRIVKSLTRSSNG